MPATPEVTPLSYGRRRRFFYVLVLVFVVAVPIFVFYATGYRYDFWSDSPAITTTGGLYISAEAEDNQIFLDEEEVTSLRIFRSAAYIQGIAPGVHRVHVQAPGVHTWVKELPVFGQIVTEAEAFNLPVVPQIRPITPWQTATGTIVYLDTASTSVPFAFASSSVSLMATSTTATSSFERSSEYEFVDSLFTATTTEPTLVGRVVEEVSSAFRFADPAATNTPATTTVLRDDVQLYERADEVYARYVGSPNDTPYYFCIPFGRNASTSELYGEHVAALLAQAISDIEPERSEQELAEGERWCRKEIRIDRKWQTVHWFNFLPESSDHVLLLLDDGLYVVEIDDRAWQNTQVLYPGDNLEVALNGGQIFVKDSGYYLEVFTELIEN